MKKLIFFTLKVMLLILIFFWICKSVDTRETINVLKKTNIIFFTIAFIINNTSTVFMTIKWARLSSPLNLKARFFDLLKLNYISTFYSSFIPGQSSGELVKGLKLAQKEKSLQKVWIPIFIDKVTNLLMVLLIGFVGILSDESLRSNKAVVFPVSIFTIVFVILTITLFSENTEKFILFIKGKITNFLEKFKFKTNAIKEFSVNYLESYKEHDKLIIETLLWSFLVKLPHIFAYFFLALSLNINLDIIQAAWLFSVISIITFLPISFSGLGVREGAMIILLKQLGINSSTALSFSAIILTTNILMALIGGLIEFSSWFKLKERNA